MSNRFDGEGLVGFVQKPYNPEELEASLRQVCADNTQGLPIDVS